MYAGEHSIVDGSKHRLNQEEDKYDEAGDRVVVIELDRCLNQRLDTLAEMVGWEGGDIIRRTAHRESDTLIGNNAPAT